MELKIPSLTNSLVAYTVTDRVPFRSASCCRLEPVLRRPSMAEFTKTVHGDDMGAFLAELICLN